VISFLTKKKIGLPAHETLENCSNDRVLGTLDRLFDAMEHVADKLDNGDDERTQRKRANVIAEDTAILIFFFLKTNKQTNKQRQ